MSYEVKDYSSLLDLGGLSRDLIESHLALYRGYVKNTNLIIEQSAAAAKDSAQFAELKRRLGWEFNGMRLHELYFENLTVAPGAVDAYPDIYNKIQLDFGTYDNWMAEFRALGLMRGIGWVVLYHDKWQDKFLNVWIGEHDTGHLAGCRPLIVMDVFEHAFLPDKLRRPDYIDIFFAHLDWSSAEERMKALA